MIPSSARLLLSALLAAACAAPALPPPPPRPPEPPAELGEARALLWQGRTDLALELLEDQGWFATGSVAAERLRQDLALARGDRPALAREIGEALAADPEDPDLLYLSARLLSDPERRLRALEDAARAHPGHAWLPLGVAAALQEFGRWNEAESWLASAPQDSASAAFRRLLVARAWDRDGHPNRALRLLEEDAFRSGHREALAECLRIAERGKDVDRRERARAEYALRAAAADDDPAAAMDRVIERFRAEQPFARQRDNLDAMLALLDRYCELAGAPSGWSAQPRYKLGDMAELVQPESFRGGVTRDWLAHGRFLLIGRAPGRGVDWLYLADAHRLELPAGEGRPPVEVIVARRGLEPEDRTIPGGAPFHGFFLRLDLVEAAARTLERAVGDYAPQPDGAAGLDPAPPAAGNLECYELALRLRARRLAAGAASARDLELLHLLLHEVGHLPETLPWARAGVPVLGVAPAVLRSLLRYEDPILFLEERAQLRALACGVETDWAFAELLDRAQAPRDPYYRPYRALLEALVERGESAGLPPLHAWDRLPPGRLAALAAEELAARSLRPLPGRLAASALRGLDASEPFDQLDAADLAARLEHDGQVEAQRP
jgi:hypothetical protein